MKAVYKLSRAILIFKDQIASKKFYGLPLHDENGKELWMSGCTTIDILKLSDVYGKIQLFHIEHHDDSNPMTRLEVTSASGCNGIIYE